MATGCRDSVEVVDDFRLGALFACELGVADDRVEGGAELVAHLGEEATLLPALFDGGVALEPELVEIGLDRRVVRQVFDGRADHDEGSLLRGRACAQLDLKGSPVQPKGALQPL